MDECEMQGYKLLNETRETSKESIRNDIIEMKLDNCNTNEADQDVIFINIVINK